MRSGRQNNKNLKTITSHEQSGGRRAIQTPERPTSSERFFDDASDDMSGGQRDAFLVEL